MYDRDFFILLSQRVYSFAKAKGKWPKVAAAKSDVIKAAMDRKLSIYDQPRFIREREAVPAYAFANLLNLESLELHSQVDAQQP